VLPVPVFVVVIGGFASRDLGMLLVFARALVEVGEVGLVGFGQVT
jgi:hypothetical protein